MGAEACGHEYERHLFGGMCFYCDCKRATYDSVARLPGTARPKRKPSRNGTGKKSKKRPRASATSSGDAA